MLKVGERAPACTAPQDDGTTFAASAWLGTKIVVLYFYPKDFTAGCTKEACGFRDNYEAILGEGAGLLGISRGSVESHRRFRETYGLPFPLVSDADGSVARAYRVERRFIVPLPMTPRVTYVIDKEGVIAGAFQHELAIGKHQDDVLRTLRRLNGSA